MKRTWIGVAALIALVLVAQPAAATFPGGNGKIAYFDYTGEPIHIYSIDPDGSGRVRLTSGSLADQYPAWSADGSTIAYVRSRGIETGRHSILTMNADGSGDTVLFRARDSRKEILDPAWSPDGTQIVFCAEGRQPPALFVIGADGTGLTKLTRGRHFDCHPSWSPDGNTIAFATIRGRQFSIATMATDGSNRTLLVRRGSNDVPDWSPDGSQLVFFRVHGRRSDVFIIDADGTGLTRVTHSTKRWEWSPTFSPDGQRIAFGRGQGRTIVARSDIFSMATDGTDVQRLTNTDRLDEFWLTWQPI